MLIHSEPGHRCLCLEGDFPKATCALNKCCAMIGSFVSFTFHAFTALIPHFVRAMLYMTTRGSWRVINIWPRGLMDKASDFGSEDCEFESRRGQFIFNVTRLAKGTLHCLCAHRMDAFQRVYIFGKVVSEVYISGFLQKPETVYWALIVTNVWALLIRGEVSDSCIMSSGAKYSKRINALQNGRWKMSTLQNVQIGQHSPVQ